jgi:DNA-binding XRE family transcriptional regulator
LPPQGSFVTVEPLEHAIVNAGEAHEAMCEPLRRAGEIAEATGLHRNTITNIEVGRYAGDLETLSKIRKAFEAAGVEFIHANGGGGPGVRLRDNKS